MKEFWLKYCWPYRRYYFLGCLALLVTNLLTMGIPITIKCAVDAYVAGAGWAGMKHFLLIIVALSAAMMMVRSLSRIWMFLPGRHVEYDLRRDLYRHLMTLSSDFYRKASIGDLMSRFVNDIQNIRLMTGLAVLHVVNTSIMYVLVFYEMGRISPLLLFSAALPIPIAMIFVKKMAQNLYHYTENAQGRLGQLTNFIVETLGGIHIIKSFAAEDGIKKAFDAENADYEKANLRVGRVRSRMFPFIGIISSIGHVILFFVGGQMVINGQLSLGEFVAFSTYIYLLAWPTAAFAWIVHILQRGRVSLSRIQSILDEQPRVADGPQTDYALKVSQSILLEVKDLNFRFPESKDNVLSDISFSLKPGHTLGLFGPTGSGKTVLANLLAGVEKAPVRTVWINGRPLEQWPVEIYRSMLAYVPQSSFLFSESIAGNIAYGQCDDDGYDEDRLFSSAQRACVAADIQAFPQQYQTVVGEKGVLLSGGQRHRIALARALYKEHGFLILDDILSSVDHDTEKKLVDHVLDQGKHLTKIIISHRISALTGCEHILVLEHGRITDQGKHEDLILREGIYRDTWNYQKMVGDV